MRVWDMNGGLLEKKGKIGEPAPESVNNMAARGESVSGHVK